MPPFDRTPNDPAPVVAMLPTVTVAAWPKVLSVTPLAATPPVVLMLTGAALATGVKLSAPPVDVRFTAPVLVVAIGPVPA